MFAEWRFNTRSDFEWSKLKHDDEVTAERCHRNCAYRNLLWHRTLSCTARLVNCLYYVKKYLSPIYKVSAWLRMDAREFGDNIGHCVTISHVSRESFTVSIS